MNYKTKSNKKTHTARNTTTVLAMTLQNLSSLNNNPLNLFRKTVKI